MAVDVSKVPSTPGVYKFFSNHEIIYIGKAKNLKKRVSSYFGKSIKDIKELEFFRNSLIILDEVHYGSSNDSVISKLFLR